MAAKRYFYVRVWNPEFIDVYQADNNAIAFSKERDFLTAVANGWMLERLKRKDLLKAMERKYIDVETLV